MKYCKICNKEIEPHRTYCSNKCKFSDASYKKSLVSTDKNDPSLNTKCNICSKIFTDEKNKSGTLSRHLRDEHNLHNVNVFDYFTVVKAEVRETLKCPYCDWTTVDLTNKSGMFTSHLKKKHNLSQSEVIKEFPDMAKLWKMHVIHKNTEELLKDKYASITCKICNKKLQKITISHLKIHGITVEEYKHKYGLKVLSSERLRDNQRLITAGNEAFTNDRYKNTKGEVDITTFIHELGFETENNTRKYIKGKEIDIYIPSKKVAIEFNGLWAHREENYDKWYHKNKTELCEAEGIHLLQIFEDEWWNKNDIVKAKIKSVLNVNEKSVYARKCIIKEISAKESSQFLNENHIQGSDNASIRFALVYENELVAVMTFGKLRGFINNKNKSGYELIRFATNCRVIGGASKLLNHFKKIYDPILIHTYADRRWTTKLNENNLYEILGFKLISYGSPGYFYMDNSFKKRHHRYAFTKHNLIKAGHDPNKSELTIMTELGWSRIWDCGHLKYELS